MSVVKLEKMARRAMQWAERSRMEGDGAGVEMAMQRYRRTASRIASMIDAAFAPRIEIDMGATA